MTDTDELWQSIYDLQARAETLENHMLTVMNSLIQADLLQRPDKDLIDKQHNEYWDKNRRNMKDSTDWPEEN